MNPYYDDGQIQIYHGDCREILPALDTVDLLLTDPPYGIASVWQGGFGRGWKTTAKSDAVFRNAWDMEAPDLDTLMQCVSLAKHAVVWGGNYFSLPPSRGWLVWNKPERGFSLADAELAWTNRDNVIRVADMPRSDHGRQHPTQKPLRLMKWCINFFPDAQTILDPFAGSGTTGRAAKDLGRKAVLIEIEERYCEIAARRLEQAVLPLAMAD